jgi:integrase/DNA-binding transcriptional regulator YhcF (GntR family)
MYAKYLEKHVRPFVGRLKAGSMDAEVLDSLYAELRRCRVHCTDRRRVDHRTPREHVCDERCGPHRCRPLSSATIRHIHFVLRGAYEKGVRWRWVGTNPVLMATPPAARRPEPRPPSAEEAARLVEDAWDDPDWGMLVWLMMTTGARRGELCALRWRHVDLAAGVVTLSRAIAQDGTHREEKDTKTHQHRRVTLDPETVAALTEHWDRCRERAAAGGVALGREAFVFSLVPDGSVHLVPSSVSQRYARLARRLGIDTHLHSLRHFSATELIAAGVDVRTVAGRLGHSGGGITTLRVYAAWLAEADQRASAGLAARMPMRPVASLTPAERALARPANPREHLAVQLRERVVRGELAAGDVLPGIKQLAQEHSLSTSTVQRAFLLLREWGVVEGGPGQRARVAGRLPTERTISTRDPEERSVTAAATSEPMLMNLEVRHIGQTVARVITHADPTDSAELRRLLLGRVL